MTELYRKYRPKTLDGIIGNEVTVNALRNMLERKTLPHNILFHGPSGCGKTTMARILRRELECSEMDFRELNCSDFRGIDTIREISRSMNLSPSAGPCRVWLLDEVHQLSKDGQNAALKIWEDTPDHVYFFLCTTDPQKLLKTIRDRFTKMEVKLLEYEGSKRLISRVAKKEGIELSEDNVEAIINSADGSARSTLVMLQKMSNLPEDQRNKAVTEFENEKEGIELCRALYKRESWSKVSKIIKALEGDPESIRWAVLGYAKSILLNKPDQHAFHIINCFENHFFDSKEAGLVRACFEVICCDPNA